MSDTPTRTKGDLLWDGVKESVSGWITAFSDPEFYTRDIAGHAGQAALGGAAGIVGAPVDLAKMALDPFSETVREVDDEDIFMSSAWVGEQLGADRDSLAYKAGEIGMPDPKDVGAAGSALKAILVAAGPMTQIPNTSRRIVGATAEGMAVHEIPDAAAEINIDTFARNRSGSASGKVPLGDMLRHDELYKDFPDLQDVGVVIKDMPGRQYGAYDPNKDIIALASHQTVGEARSGLLHEVEHVVQNRTDMPSGTNVRAVSNLYSLDLDDPVDRAIAYKIYEYEEGEALARATQQRRDYGERGQLEPLETTYERMRAPIGDPTKLWDSRIAGYSPDMARYVEFARHDYAKRQR